MISEKIQLYLKNKSHVKITRSVGDNTEENSRGYILDFSDNFILVQETDDFKVLGYIILPISQIKTIHFLKNEQYYTKIMIWEGEADKVGISYKINLSSWQSIFKSIKAVGLNVIVECENPDIDTFTIGAILKTTQKKVHIEYFDAAGFIDEDPVKIDVEDITKVNFDDRYINVFSKYLRRKKVKSTKKEN